MQVAVGYSRRSAGTLAHRMHLRGAHQEEQLSTVDGLDPALRLACEGAGLGIWEWDLRTGAMAYSQVAKAICGFAADGDVTFEMARQVTHPDDLPQTSAQSERALDPAVRASEPYEYRIIRPDGALRWVLAFGHPVFEDVDGKPQAVRYVGTIQDITERKVATDALEASDRRLRLALDAGRLAVWEWDARSGTVTSSVDLNRIFGFADDYQPTQAERSARYLPGEEERVRGVARAALVAGRTDFEVEYRFQRLDGEERWALLRAQLQLQLDGAGAPSGAIGVLLDVTERKQVEVALVQSETRLRESEAQLRQLNQTLEQRVAERTSERDLMWRLSQDLLLVIGLDGVIRAVNPAAEALGYLPGDVVGRPFGEFVHPDDIPIAADAVGRAMTGPISDVEVRLQTRDGGVQVYCWSASSAEGAVYAIGRDITEEKSRKQALLQAEEALRQSQKMEAMGQLTGGVAHDFNNLLMPIMGSLDVLKRRSDPDAREQRLIDGAMQAAERAKTLVQRLLAFARRQPLRTGPVELGVLVADMAELIASTCGPGVDLRTDITDDIPAVEADANQLEMALLNLAVNARDAMPEGGCVTIAAEFQEIASAHRTGLKPGGYVRLSVSDTGSGMSPEVLQRAVEPFFSTKGVGRGTGLGLSMVHGLAAQLGGALLIDSKPGQGTRVELWLPTAAAAHEEIKETSTRPASAGAGPFTALLVDDEPLVREATAGMLADLGYQVIEASDSAEAQRLLDGMATLDILVTDHMMPGMTGAELARLVRQVRPGTPVLVVSGYAAVDAIAPDLPRLAKPFVQEDLALSIAKIARLPRKAR